MMRCTSLIGSPTLTQTSGHWFLKRVPTKHELSVDEQWCVRAWLVIRLTWLSSPISIHQTRRLVEGRLWLWRDECIQVRVTRVSSFKVWWGLWYLMMKWLRSFEIDMCSSLFLCWILMESSSATIGRRCQDQTSTDNGQMLRHECTLRSFTLNKCWRKL